MKHSSPSGAQRTCQSPKVSLTISITSGWAGRRPGAGAAGAAPAGGRRAAGGGRGRRGRGAGGGRAAGAGGGAGAAGASGGGPPALARGRCGGRGRVLGGERRGERQPERSRGSGGYGSVASCCSHPSD